MNFTQIAKSYHDEDSARAFLEAQRWPDGKAGCPHCGLVGESTKLPPIAGKPKKDGEITYRKGVWKCASCRKQFTVTIGTIFEDSHIPLNKWLLAIHLMCASEKGISARQLQGTLKIGYRGARLLVHRIRFGIEQSKMRRLSLHPLGFREVVRQIMQMMPDGTLRARDQDSAAKTLNSSLSNFRYGLMPFSRAYLVSAAVVRRP